MVLWLEHLTGDQEDGGSIPPTAVSKLGQFRSPHFACALGRDSKSHWSLLPGVYAKGSKRSHIGDKFVTCRLVGKSQTGKSRHKSSLKSVTSKSSLKSSI